VNINEYHSVQYSSQTAASVSQQLLDLVKAIKIQAKICTGYTLRTTRYAHVHVHLVWQSKSVSIPSVFSMDHEMSVFPCVFYRMRRIRS